MNSQIQKSFQTHNLDRLVQGDILKDFSHKHIQADGTVIDINFPYVVIMTQDCDLEQGNNIPTEYNRIFEDSENIIHFNQFLPNILLCPAFLEDEIKQGNHLKYLYNISQDKINSDKIKSIKQNKNDRYHFVKSDVDFQIPDLIIDFKIYFSSATESVLKYQKTQYMATIAELFREHLLQRFANFLSRIGLPNL